MDRLQLMLIATKTKINISLYIYKLYYNIVHKEINAKICVREAVRFSRRSIYMYTYL